MNLTIDIVTVLAVIQFIGTMYTFTKTKSPILSMLWWVIVFMWLVNKASTVFGMENNER